MQPISPPSLVDSATILAAVAALVGLPVAWRSYVADTRRSREELVRGVRSVVAALEPEMNIVRHWAESETGEGYPPHGDEMETYTHYRAARLDWLNPLRGLQPLVCPAISALPLSPYAGQLGPILWPFGLLNSAIAALAKAEDGRMTFVNQSPALIARMRRLWNETDQEPTPEEGDFLEIVFFHNFAMHVEIIGSAASPNENSLFRAYRAARTALTQFAETWERRLPPLPRWHGIVDVASWLMIIAAVVIFCLWYWRMIDPMPHVAWTWLLDKIGCR